MGGGYAGTATLHREDPGLILLLLLAALVVVSVPSLLRAQRPWTPGALVVAAAAFVAGWVLLPVTAYVPGGHEGLYLLAAAGEPVDPGSEGPFATLPVAFALAEALGRVGGRTGELLWLLLNRLAVPAIVLAAAGIARAAAPSTEGARAERFAALVAAGAVVACVPLHAHAATGFFVAPATAFAAIGLLLAVHGRFALAIGWGALAVGARLETLPLALLAAGAAPLFGRLVRARRGPPGPAVISLALAGIVGWDLFGRGRPPVDSVLPAVDLLGANLAAAPLLGPLADPAAAALGVLVVVVGALTAAGPRRDPQARRGALLLILLLIAGLASVAALLPLVDIGARHFLPAGFLAATLAGAAAGRTRGGGRWVVAAAAIAVAVGFARDLPGMLDTHAAGAAGPDRRWTLEPLPGGAMVRCTLLREGAPAGPGIAEFSGAEVLAARRARAPCLVVDAPDAHVIRGDARADRLDRARLLFGLRPATFEDRVVWIAGD